MAENVTIARPYAEAAFQPLLRAMRWGLGRHLIGCRQLPLIRKCGIASPIPSSSPNNWLDSSSMSPVPDCCRTAELMSAFLSTTSVCRCFPRSVTCSLLSRTNTKVSGGEHRLCLPDGRFHAEDVDRRP